MSPQPHEGPAEEGLSSSLLGLVQHAERVEHLRRVLSGFCHRCRNSLNGIKLSLYLVRREARGDVPDNWGEIEAFYQQVEQLFDHLQTIYRPMTITAVRTSLDALIYQQVPKWRTRFESRGMAVQLDPPDSEVDGEFDPAHLSAGLDAMATWRAEVGQPGGMARVSWRVDDGSIEIGWRETTPRDPRESPKRAGNSPPRDADPRTRGVDVLALPLLARIVAGHTGCLRRVKGPGFGVLLRWPQYQRTIHDGVA